MTIVHLILLDITIFICYKFSIIQQTAASMGKIGRKIPSYGFLAGREARYFLVPFIKSGATACFPFLPAKVESCFPKTVLWSIPPRE